MVKSLMHWLRTSRRGSNETNEELRLLKITDVDVGRVESTNPFILTGYRARLGFFGCLKSVFVLHNETINIWSHLLGFTFFAGLFIHDLVLVIPNVTDDGTAITKTDFLILSTLLICYQATMILSSLYHTFECHSSTEVADTCMSLDILGITFGLMATYLSGIYFAFWCDPGWRDFYLCTVGAVFIAATSLHFAPAKYMCDEGYQKLRVILFTSWAVYGIVPTIHWSILQGGSAAVALMIPRVLVMYAICGTALFFYVAKFPERIWPGMVDFIGHSHQWWHVIIFLALLFWHRTGVTFALFRLRHGCVDSDLIKEEDLNELSLSFWPF